MAITTEREPYEFLVRWKDGNLVGAHVRWLYKISGDGMVPVETESGAESISLAGKGGFPLSDLLTQAQIDALISRDEALSQLATAQDENKTLAADAAALRSKLDE